MSATLTSQINAVGGEGLTGHHGEPFIKYAQLVNPNVMKVVRDHLNNAFYFFRAPIPA